MPSFIECPKCLGAGHFTAFAHIAAGKCFTCAGNGTIEAGKAVSTPASAPVSTPGCKNITLPGFGHTSITRDVDGLVASWEHGMAWFRVVGREVVINLLSDGPRARKEGPALQAALQGALRV